MKEANPNTHMNHLREEIFSSANKSLRVLRSVEQEQRQLFHPPTNNDTCSSNPEPSNHSIALGNLHRQLIDGIFNFEMLVEVAEYIECLEGDSAKHRNQVRRLVEENTWIREELCTAQQRLVSCESQIAELQVQLESKQFLDSLAESAYSSNMETKTNSSNDLAKASAMDWAAGTTDSEGMSGSQMIGVTSAMGGGYEMSSKLKTLHNLVVQYASQGRFEVAVPLCKQALEDLEKSNGRDHLDVATMLNILALVYRDQGKFMDSAMLLNESLGIRERTLGADHPVVASTLNNLAVLFGKLKKYKESETLCKQALQIREKVHGADHPDVAKQLCNLALICFNQNKFDETESYYHKAIDIYQAKLGKEDPSVFKTKISLAGAYMKQSKYADAEFIYKEVLNHHHEQEHGKRNAQQRPIWMEAEALENSGAMPAFHHVAQQHLQQHPVSSLSSCLSSCTLFPSLSSSASLDNVNLANALRNLSIIYRRQGKLKAAGKLEEYLANFIPHEPPNASSGASVQYPATRPSLPVSIICSDANSYARVASSGVPAGVVLGVSSQGLQSRVPQFQSQPQLDRMDYGGAVVLRQHPPQHRNRSSAVEGGGGWWRHSRNSLHLPNENKSINRGGGRTPTSATTPSFRGPHATSSPGYGELKKSSSMTILPGGFNHNTQEHRKSGSRRGNRVMTPSDRGQAPSPSANYNNQYLLPTGRSPSNENVGFGAFHGRRK